MLCIIPVDEFHCKANFDHQIYYLFCCRPADAAKIATHLMLQEEWGDPINRALALYLCCAYVENPVPEPWRQPDPEEDPKAETVRRPAAALLQWMEGR